MRDDIDTETIGLSDDLRVEDPALDQDDGEDDHASDTAFGARAIGVNAAAMSQPNGFVTSFDLTPRDEALVLSLTQTQLPQLQAECDPSDDVVHGWRRVRGRKGSRVRLWERGSASALTLTGVDGKLKALRRKSVPLHCIRTWRQAPVPTPARDAAVPPPVLNKSSDKETYAVRSSITVHAPLASVMKTLDCSTATSHRSFTKIIYSGLIADTSVLTHKRQTDAGGEAADSAHLAESVAVRWVVCKCSSPLVSDCDLSLVEYSKVHSIDEQIAAGDAPNNNEGDDDATLRASDGLRVREKLPVAYKVFRSMETRHCPVLSEAPHHLERVHVPLGGFLLYATDNDDVTDVVFFMSVSYERKKQTSHVAPSLLSSDDRQFRAIQHVLHQMALGIGRLANAVDAYTMSLQLETLKLTRWIENSDRSECAVCYHRFHPITRRRHHCRMCGEVICRDCSIHKDADLPTIGPTTLRICKLCDVQCFGRTSVLATIATDVKQTAITLQRPELALETTAFHSPTAARHRRQTVISIEPSNSGSRDTILVSPKTIVAAGGNASERVRRHSASQPQSCPKPSQEAPPRRLVQKWTQLNTHAAALVSPKLPLASPRDKWSKAFMASRATAMQTSSQRTFAATSPVPGSSTSSTTRSSPRPSPLNSPKFARTMPVPRSATKATTQRFNFSLMKGAAPPTHHSYTRPRQSSSGDSSLESPHGQWKTTPVSFTSTLPHKTALDPESILLKSQRKASVAGSENQTRGHDHERGSTTTASLGRRTGLDHIEQYEDLLGELCNRAIDATNAKYAAVSIFTLHDPISTQEVTTLPMAHYLKVKDAPKLMKIAANLRCCEPVLRVIRPVVTRDALTFKLDGYDFATLPFVKGPQQARFYAGVPIEDSQQRLVGAVAVLDAKFVDDEDELMDSPGLLASIARATMARVDARRAEKALDVFMKTPLLRPSERMTTARHDGGALTLKDLEVDEDADEERQRTTPRATTVTTSSPMMHHSQGPPASSSKTNSLSYYKHQMHRLVQQANQTQDQVMQNSMKMHGVSF